MIVTINTDASYSNKYKLAAFAFWIVSDKGKICKAGPLKEKAHNPTHAELMAIANAVYIFCEAFKKGHFSGVSKIIINTDCLNGIYIITDDVKNIRRYNLKSTFYKKSVQFIKKLIGEHLPGVKIELRHVKAHKSTETAREWVNDWCDRSAKEELGKLLNNLN